MARTLARVAGQHQRGGAAESAMLASAPQPVDPTPGMTILPLDGGTARTLANTDLPAWVGGIGLAVAGRPSATAVDPSASISTND